MKIEIEVKLKRIITIEFDRLKITTYSNCQKMIWCEICQAETEFINQTETIELVKIMQMQGLNVNRDNLHLYQTDETQTLVCLSSIINGYFPEKNKYEEQFKTIKKRST